MPPKRPNRPSPWIGAAVEKVRWLRHRRHADPEVAETLDVIAEALVRLDEGIRATESRVILAHQSPRGRSFTLLSGLLQQGDPGVEPRT